jgi:hypothetical protein
MENDKKRFRRYGNHIAFQGALYTRVGPVQ